MALSIEGEPNQMSQLEYEGCVGSLSFASTCSRPDISFPVHYVARGNIKRTTSLVESLDRIICFAIQTNHLGLKYGETYADLTPQGYMNVSLEVNVKGEDQHSSYGWVLT